MVKKKLILGILVFSLSYLQFFLPKQIINPFSLIFFFFMFSVGAILIFDAITLKLYHKSLLNGIIKNKKNFISFMLVSTVGAVILELFAKWLAKLWIYPHWSYMIIYLVLFIPAFFVYWLLICESYLATKALLDYYRGGKKYVKKSFRWEPTFFLALGVIGIFLLVVSGVWVYQDYSNQNEPMVKPEDLYSKNLGYVMPFGSILLIFFGAWFLLEYGEYKLRGSSLIKDIAHNYLTPLIAILIGSFVLALIMESQNIIYKLWVYINWPFEGLTFLGLPITMFLVWPLHYIFFLSLFRTFNPEESSEVWKGDLIK